MLGGLVPERLARDDDLVPAHLGTSDVDILLITHVELEADLGGVERALNRMNFEPDPTADGRRWRGPVGGWQVKLEFLCDLPRSPGGRDDPATRMHEPRRRQPSRHRLRCSGLRVGGPAQPPRTTTTSSTCFCTTAPAARNRQRSVCSTEGWPTLSERCGRHLSRYESVTGGRPTAGRLDMPSRQSTLSRRLTRRCCERTPSTSCSDSSRYWASEHRLPPSRT